MKIDDIVTDKGRIYKYQIVDINFNGDIASLKSLTGSAGHIFKGINLDKFIHFERHSKITGHHLTKIFK